MEGSPWGVTLLRVAIENAKGGPTCIGPPFREMQTMLLVGSRGLRFHSGGKGTIYRRLFACRGAGVRRRRFLLHGGAA